MTTTDTPARYPMTSGAATIVNPDLAAGRNPAPRMTITADTFRRIIGDALASHDHAAAGMWADRRAAAVAFVDVARTAAGMVDDAAFLDPGDDQLAAEVATILDPSANGAGLATTDRGPEPADVAVVMVDAIRDAVRRWDTNPAPDDRCDRHLAGPVDAGRHPGFAGYLYVTRYACGCTDVDGSGDVPER